MSGPVPSKVVLAAGGTGGHMFPAQALAQLDTGERAGELSRVLNAIATEESSRASASGSHSTRPGT